ncbi:MAG TPA: hypothetical protein VJ576_20980 [Rhodocyclaceae bacterium]|nr:hypothetical protein [Rhodocyclaceae bacterium]
MRLVVLLLAVLVTACATKLGKDGQREVVVDAKYLAKTEIDRVADSSRAEVVGGLLLIADKLYRRNPREWKKAGLASREAALERLQRRTPAADLGGSREGQAAGFAFREDYAGDRVGALVFGLLTMVDAAFEHKEEFFVLDGLNEQKLANCARNMEVAVWKLGSARNGAGELLLLSNELEAGSRNLSFEREFGRIIGLLDFMARVVADRNGRNISRLTQSMATAVFLPVGILK